jgi:hypothetical protein
VTDTNVIKLAQPGTFADTLTEILRDGARAVLAQAVETEVADFLRRYAGLKTEAGHQRTVRHGHLPEREIMTGIGSVAVRQPRVRDREAIGDERIRFSPSILPPYARRTSSLAEKSVNVNPIPLHHIVVMLVPRRRPAAHAKPVGAEGEIARLFRRQARC